MARPKTLDAGLNQTFRTDEHTRNMLLALKLDDENTSATLRRVVREYAELALGYAGLFTAYVAYACVVAAILVNRRDTARTPPTPAEDIVWP
jgi:hypothetical protein